MQSEKARPAVRGETQPAATRDLEIGMHSVTGCCVEFVVYSILSSEI